MEEYVMRVSTKICLEKEKKNTRINKKQRKKSRLKLCVQCV